MARFRVDGVFDFEKLLNADVIPDQALYAAGDVVVRAQRQSATRMLTKGYSTGKVAKSISKGKIISGRDGKSIYITVKGSRTRGKKKKHTTRNAEIAFVNEYGRRGQPPRPFIQQANERCRDEAIEAAEKEYDKWLESMGF